MKQERTTGCTNADAVARRRLIVLAVKAEAALPDRGGTCGTRSERRLLHVAASCASRTPASPDDDPRSIAERTRAAHDAAIIAGLRSLAAATLASGRADGGALVCGDDAAAKELALALAGDMVTGRALDAGPLAAPVRSRG